VGVVLYGGAFDPPHLGHVAVADAAREQLDVERLVVLVSEHPAHRGVHASIEDRLALARAAFPGDDVRLDPYPRTVELLRAVARRPGFPAGELEAVLAQLDRPDRVLFLELEPNPAASTDFRGRIALGKSLDGLVPDAVSQLIEDSGLYRP